MNNFIYVSVATFLSEVMNNFIHVSTAAALFAVVYVLSVLSIKLLTGI